MAQLLRSNDQKEWKTARDGKKTRRGTRVERDRSTEMYCECVKCNVLATIYFIEEQFELQ